MKIEGAKLIGSTWHYYKRVPKKLVEAYGLPEFKRGTMDTKDPKLAAEKAREMLSEFFRMEQKLDSLTERVRLFDELSSDEQARVKRDIAARVALLPNDQQTLLQREGGPLKAIKEIDEAKVEAAFLVGTTRAEYELKDEFGDDYDPDDRADQEELERIKLGRMEGRAEKLDAALIAAGIVEPKAGSVKGLRSLLDKFCEAKGYVHANGVKNKTRGQYEYAVRRFVEYHGDHPLSELTRKHLSDFALDFLKLPKSSRKDIRPLEFWDAVKLADDENLPRVSERTRNQNLTLMKSLMAFAVNEGYREDGDPWARYLPTVAKQKVSDKHSNKRYVFTADDVRRTVAHASANNRKSTIDYWGPLLGAFHGLRLEEVAQFYVGDVNSVEGMLCLSVTDAGVLQKVKNENTFRVIPVHQGLLERGFDSFVQERRKANGTMLFLREGRYTGKMSEVSHDGQGRFGTTYGSRFRTMVERLGIEGHRVGYHSYRHAWTDLARNAGIDPEQRRALAGRDSDATENEVGPKSDPTENRYGHGFSIAVLSQSLNRLRPLD